MKDCVSGERVVVRIHERYGPYIRIQSFEDGGALEEIMDEQYFILYWKATPQEFRDKGGNEYYFGGAADPVKIQGILDSLEF